jgi:hypothetical protein
MLPALLLTASLAALVRATPNPAETVTATALTPCAVVRCAANTTCVVIGGRASCQPIGREKCGAVLCTSGTTCCNALCGICTPPGMMCVQGCAVQPNRPVLTLTPVVRKEVVAEPVPSAVEVKCGKNVCGEGEECCNSSCGVCVKKGGFCTLQWCGPVDEEVVEPAEPTTLPPKEPIVVGEKCGRNVCGKGQFCCNSSCSQCAPLGGACTMQFCGHESVN